MFISFFYVGNVIVNLQIFLKGGIGMGMLQDRINELDSAIVNVVGKRSVPDDFSS